MRNRFNRPFADGNRRHDCIVHRSAASTVSIPLVLHAVMGERMLGPLSKAKDWLESHNAAVLAVVITVIGVYLTVKGLR